MHPLAGGADPLTLGNTSGFRVMRILHYNCSAGICGDMNLGAMIALGVDADLLLAELDKLPLNGWSLQYDSDIRSGISGIRCDVKLAHEPHPEHHHHPEHPQEHPQEHTHGGHSHARHHCEGHHHAHRTFRSIREMIEGAALKDSVKADAIAVFRVLAEAEGAVHDKPADDVHFHEVGAVDSIIDIVGAAICWDLLGVDAIASSTVELGGGTVQCAHGRMPVPAPATARLLEACPVSLNATDREATTPTGAALLVGKACRFNEPLAGRQLKAATGIGQRKDPNIANVLHVALYETETGAGGAATVWELAANLDDMTPEQVSFLCEQLLSSGALDVWQTPATFKKGRVGVVVSALARLDCLESVESSFLKHSRTLGLRRRKWGRTVLDRRIENVDTKWGPVRVKLAVGGDGEVLRSKPEYEDCKAIAERHGLSLSEVLDAVNRKAGA